MQARALSFHDFRYAFAVISCGQVVTVVELFVFDTENVHTISCRGKQNGTRKYTRFAR